MLRFDPHQKSALRRVRRRHARNPQRIPAMADCDTPPSLAPAAGMHRLQAELTRLYLLPDGPPGPDGPPSPTLISAAGQVRALVMELAEPPSWDVLARVWRGVQSDWELPAPAIAVSGRDGLQLWFSLARAVPAAQGLAFLEGLRQHYLPDVDARRVRLYPAVDAQTPHRHAPLVPALQEPGGNWSAFLAVDLVAIFAETPWLDIPPGDEGQAALLQALTPIEPAAFEAAAARLCAAPPRAHASGSTPGPSPVEGLAATPAPEADPRRFLLQVMQDPSVPLALRIEAAKALLPGSHSAPC